LRRLLPAGLISVALMTGCNGHNDNAQNAGPEESPSDSSLAVSSNGGEIVNEAAARLADSSIRFHDGRLSAALDDMPLLQVVTEGSRQTGIEIQFIGEHPALTMNIHFNDSPLEHGLRRLLGDVNTIFVHANAGQDGNHDGQLTKVLILPEGENYRADGGTLNIVDTLSVLSEQIRNSIPLSDQSASSPAPVSVNGVLTDQTLQELTENLQKRLSDLGLVPEAGTVDTHIPKNTHLCVTGESL